MDSLVTEKGQRRDAGPRLVLVEPDPSVRDAIAGALSLMGLDVMMATGTLAQVGLDVREEADVLLVDWMSSTSDAALQMLGGLDANARGRVVLMSVNREGSRVADELALGGFIEKPMSFPEASEKLGKLARHVSRERRRARQVR